MVFEKIASFFVFSVPYILAVAGYYWLLKKILRLENKLWKIIAMAVWLFGCGYTIVIFSRSVDEVFSPMNFDLALIAINCLFMLGVAIAIALGKPEDSGKGNRQ